MSEAGSKRRFTETMAQRLNPPKRGRAEYADAVCPGLVLRVTDRGVKTFSVIYKVPGETHVVSKGRTKGTRLGGVSATGRLLRGQQHRITLGQWPAKGLVEARENARTIMTEALAGCDPRPKRREQNLIRHSNTFDTVLARYVDQDLKPNVASWEMASRVLEKHVKPDWVGRPLSGIGRADVHALLDQLTEPAKDGQRRVGTAREVRKHLSRFFNWALDRELVLANPIHGLKRVELAQNDEAGRALANDELRAVWAAAGELEYPFGPFHKLLVLTGQRRNEWADAQRSEISERKRWLEIPKARYKGNRDHIVPLAEQAWSIFEKLPVWPGNDYFLFSTRGGKKPISGFSKAKRDLDDGALAALQKHDGAATLTPYRVHDFRVTCETRLADLGFSQEVRDAVLGHAKTGLQRNYNKHDYASEKRAALEGYAAHVEQVLAA